MLRARFRHPPDDGRLLIRILLQDDAGPAALTGVGTDVLPVEGDEPLGNEARWHRHGLAGVVPVLDGQVGEREQEAYFVRRCECAFRQQPLDVGQKSNLLPIRLNRDSCDMECGTTAGHPVVQVVVRHSASARRANSATRWDRTLQLNAEKAINGNVERQHERPLENYRFAGETQFGP